MRGSGDGGFRNGLEAGWGDGSWLGWRGMDHSAIYLRRWRWGVGLFFSGGFFAPIFELMAPLMTFGVWAPGHQTPGNPSLSLETLSMFLYILDYRSQAKYIVS